MGRAPGNTLGHVGDNSQEASLAGQRQSSGQIWAGWADEIAPTLFLTSLFSFGDFSQHA